MITTHRLTRANPVDVERLAEWLGRRSWEGARLTEFESRLLERCVEQVGPLSPSDDDRLEDA